MTKDNQETDVDSDVQEQPAAAKQDRKVGPYAWFVLFMALMVRIAYQWQRAILSYAYGYTGLGV